MCKLHIFLKIAPTCNLTPAFSGLQGTAIDILYGSVCYADLHTARNEWQSTLYLSVPGHEIVGRVSAVGVRVSRFKPGDIAGVGCMVDSCLRGSACGDGLEQHCDNGFTGTRNGPVFGGENTFGGCSSRIVVQQKFVLRISHQDQLAAVAPLLCAGIPPIRRCASGTCNRARRWPSSAWEDR